MSRSASAERRGAILAMALLAAPSLAACTSFRFEPERPLRSPSGSVELDLRALRVGWSRGFIYATRTETPVAFTHARLATADSEPCKGGLPAKELRVDGVVTRLLPAGSHELEVRFPRGYLPREDVFTPQGMPTVYVLDDFDHDAVIDLVTQEGACVRAPAIDRAVTMTQVSRTLIVVGAEGGGGGAQGALRGYLDAQLGVGHWVGPWLLSATAGIGGVFCGKEPWCSGGGVAYPLTLEAAYTPGVFAQNHQMHLALFGVRYSYLWANLAGPSGGHHGADAQLVQGLIGWGNGPHPLGPFEHGERGMLQELKLLLGVLVDPDVSRPVVFMAGMDFRVDIPL